MNKKLGSENNFYPKLIHLGAILIKLRNYTDERIFDHTINEVVSGVKNSHAKLKDVIDIAESSVNDIISSIEVALSYQSELADFAIKLLKEWNDLDSSSCNFHKNKVLIKETRVWLERVPYLTACSSRELHSIMMKQSLQDTAGQTIKKMSHVLDKLDLQLRVCVGTEGQNYVTDRETHPGENDFLLNETSRQRDLDGFIKKIGL